MDTESGVPRRPGDIRNTPPHGVPAPKATPREGTPIHPVGSPQLSPGGPIPLGAPSRPIVHPPSASQASPTPHKQGPQPTDTFVAGRPPEPPERGGDALWAGVPEAQNAFMEPDEPLSTTGPMGVRETSGVQVRLGSRRRARQGKTRRTGGRRGGRGGLVAAGVLVLAGLITVGLVLTRGSGDGDTANRPAAGAPGPDVPLPRAGKAIEVGTADGAKYRIAAVSSGVADGVVTTFQSPPSGTSFAYVEYLLTNPTNQKVLLDFPGDVFVKRALVAPDAQGRCMPQAGVPEDMCTPPTKSRVVRRLTGGEPIPGEGGDTYMPPGATYMVRATVDVPVQREISRKDMGLYVWKQLYMADQLAKQAPFPR
ncbi:hypothetical protein E1287_30355 [Actinomadura sp. KC06]|uniref:hypothetical protein n=1 Tax=Actinomadura sp. KC06 TaxID=2530369 RepID=UPI00104501B3|nr:hypothetical protein [Actinomadura sp. KC06]TDD29749.1 hypothetical protein E1287_30355 [Actinomadura sp. KC06]